MRCSCIRNTGVFSWDQVINNEGGMSALYRGLPANIIGTCARGWVLVRANRITDKYKFTDACAHAQCGHADTSANVCRYHA